jgi:hypothetical protein
LFAGLAALLALCAAVPAANPFDAVHNLWRGRRVAGARLAPAPPPRRFAQALAAALCLGSFLFHLLRGRRELALRTRPWAKD